MNADTVVACETCSRRTEFLLLQRIAKLLLEPVAQPAGRLEFIPESAQRKFMAATTLAREWEQTPW